MPMPAPIGPDRPTAGPSTCPSTSPIRRAARGIGKALYIDLLARLERAGFHAAFAGITVPNEASVALHESVGFTHVGIYREVGYKFDRWHDVGWWQRVL